MQKLFAFFVLFFSFVSSISAESVILALYKGHEGATAQENEILWHLSQDVQSLGYRLRYHDIDKGFPELGTEVKGLISWYRGASMNDAEAYAHWLAECTQKNIRVMVMGNYGAYQNRKTQAWLSTEQVNVFFSALGMSYHGQWSQEVNRIKLQDTHPLISAEGRNVVFRRPDYYLKFSCEDSQALKLAVLNRSDIEDGESTVISITTRGSMALHPYIFGRVNPKAPFVYAFDRRRFLQLTMNYRGDHKGDRVMLLYKSRDGQTEDSNELLWHVKPLLSSHQQIVFHDVSKGLPDHKTSEGASVFISWYRGSKMKDAKDYLLWLSSRIHAGSKVVVLGNMGAFQEADSEQWLPADDVNRLFSALGLEYFGQWTNDVQQIEFVDEDESSFHLAMPSMVERIRHYQKVQLKHPKGRSLLSLKRKDLKDGLSSMVSVTPFGGYADGAYLFFQNKGKLEPLLNLNVFLAEALKSVSID